MDLGVDCIQPYPFSDNKEVLESHKIHKILWLIMITGHPVLNKKLHRIKCLIGLNRRQHQLLKITCINPPSEGG